MIGLIYILWVRMIILRVQINIIKKMKMKILINERLIKIFLIIDLNFSH